jgi:hypothetical protein
MKNDTSASALGKLLNALGVPAHRHAQSRPAVGHPNRVDLRDIRADPIRSSAGHMRLSETHPSALAPQPIPR